VTESVGVDRSKQGRQGLRIISAGSAGYLDVVVLDDHDIVRDAMCNLLADIPVVRSVREVATAAQLFDLDPETFNAAIVDLVLPDMPGTLVLRNLAQRTPATILIAITGYADARSITRARESGAVTCLSKSTAADELRLCLEAALRGAVLLDSSTREKISASPSSPEMSELTKRELDVLELIASGLTARQVGAQLIISEATVRAHRHRIYQKLGVSSRAEATLVWRNGGLGKGQPPLLVG
jgi:DNA-binding NarL/FixJ family response regulator